MLSASRRRCRSAISLLPLLGLVALQTAIAERLPIKIYTPADGLSHYFINRIVRDSHGFLWFCTNDGLSLFDGYSFTNYRTEHGLPHSVVNDILETREGDYWVATNGGLVKFNPRGEAVNRVVYADDQTVNTPKDPMFMLFQIDPADEGKRKAINRVVQRQDGTIWFGTWEGLYVLVQTNGRIEPRVVEIGLPGELRDQKVINALVEDRYGTLWIGAFSGVFRLTTNGQSTKIGALNHIHELLYDRRGSLWVGTRNRGLFRLAIPSNLEPPQITATFNISNGLNSDWVFDLHESADGNLWVATNEGLSEIALSDENKATLVHSYTKQNGFTYHEILQVAEDRDGNIWLGSVNGVMKLTRSGFTTFDERDGVCCINSFFRSDTGQVSANGYVLTSLVTSLGEQSVPDPLKPKPNYTRKIGSYDGKRFNWVIPDALATRNLGWTQKTILESHNGEWWIGTGEGLFRFPRTSNFALLKTARPIGVYTTKNGLAAKDVFCIFEDSRNNLWVSTIGGETNGLARWDSASNTLINLAHAPGLPSFKQVLPTAFEEDRAGNVWVGFSQGGMARYRDGRFTIFSSNDGLRPGRISDLYLDRAGRLWIAMTRDGVTRIDDPTADRLTFVNYTVEQGLSSNYTASITEDLYGRIYIGTGQGLDRFDLSTGRFKHYTTADGIAMGEVTDAIRDPTGSIWVATTAGMSTFRPEPIVQAMAPPISITGLSIAGRRRKVSAIGEKQISLGALQPGENVQIDFVGVSFAFGESLSYQYRLEGAATEWSSPTTQRTINFANLAPGTYRFLVRAINSDGIASAEPAAIAFTVLYPVWQRWWFLSILAVVLALATYTLYRRRVSHLLELERVRTRIASDLHDDIGAGLSRIAILSEVAQHEAGEGIAPVKERLSVIAGASRELVDSMSDIVWVVNPKRDQLSDLTQRMRRFASDLFTSRGIEFTFSAPTDERQMKVGADARRHIYLIFKESINNSVRHSGCTEVEITLRVESGWFVLTVKDNGRGFDQSQTAEGNGLLNIQERARILGGHFQIESNNRDGTTIRLRVPLKGTLKEPDNQRLRGTQKA